MWLKNKEGNIQLIVGIVFLVISVGAVSYLFGTHQSQGQQKVSTNNTTQQQSYTNPFETPTSSDSVSPTSPATHTPVDLHNLPLGDYKYVTDGPKKGYVYLCRAQNTSNAGAFKDGPWINETSKIWDLTKKISVTGSVNWPTAKFTINTDGTNRTITSNGLPYHTTGIYPILSTDAAYQYDRNPNSIKTQTFTFTLPENPTLLSSPECVGGEVGITLSGIPIFNGFDEGGRDAVAHEVQDHCEGHPQVSGQYHYHGYSDCLKDNSKSGEHSDLVAYAFDGFGIYGLKGENGEELSSADLDECHGHTHAVMWNGKMQTVYHYHFTRDFPYSVACFRGKKMVNGPIGGTTGQMGQGRGSQGGMQQGGQMGGQGMGSSGQQGMGGPPDMMGGSPPPFGGPPMSQ